MYKKKTEQGQAIVLIAIAIVGLVSLTGLAIDGGNNFANNRQAQNAADSAALSTALTAIRDTTPSQPELEATARNLASANGFDNEDPNTTVTLNWPPDSNSAYAGNDEYVQVIIESQVDTFFAPIVGVETTNIRAEAVARAKPPENVTPFDGAGIVGLKPDASGGCAVFTGNSGAKDWEVRNGGVFSNGCFSHPNGTLDIPNDKCITAVGSANASGNGTHACVQSNQTSKRYDFPDDIFPMMPPDPCTGTLTGNQYENGGIVPSNGQTTFNNGVYCIDNFNIIDDKHIVLNNATLYVTDTEFSGRYNGGGDPGFFGTATTTEGSPYKNYYMIIKMNDTKAKADNCVQYFDFRGNGGLDLTGTILAPSTCVDYRGNSEGTSTHSQMIFYQFTGNGNASIIVDFNPDENATKAVPPQIELAE